MSAFVTAYAARTAKERVRSFPSFAEVADAVLANAGALPAWLAVVKVVLEQQRQAVRS